MLVYVISEPLIHRLGDCRTEQKLSAALTPTSLTTHRSLYTPWLLQCSRRPFLQHPVGWIDCNAGTHTYMQTLQ